MNSLLLWIRRGTGLKAFAPLVFISLLALFSRGQQWRGEWVWTVDWANGSTILTGPILAGVVAFDLYRNGRVSWREMLRGMRRGAGFPLHVITACWLFAVAAHAITLVIAISLTASTRPTGHFPAESLALGPLVLLAFAVLGAISATVGSSFLSVPAAVVFTFGLTYVGATGAVPKVFRIGGSTGSLVGLSVDYRVLLIISVFLLSLAVACAALAAKAYTPRMTPTALTSTVLAVTIGSGAYVYLSMEGDERYRPSANPPNYICAGESPRVCMAEETTRPLGLLAAEMHRQGKILTDAGIQIPEVYSQEVAGYVPEPSHGVMFMGVDEVNAPAISPYQVSNYLSVPASCDEYYADVAPERALAARSIIATLIRSRTGVSGSAFKQGSDAAKWAASPESNAWMSNTFQQLKECHLDDVKLPF